MKLERSSGILLHITSLPSAFGIGDLGPEAYEFIDFLSESGHRYWQLLPVNPTDEAYRHSPYSSFSAFAGNSLLISPKQLEKEGLVDLGKFPLPENHESEKVNYTSAAKYKEELFEEAYKNFKKDDQQISGFQIFCGEQSSWLDDYSLYKALREKFDRAGWVSWPEPLKNRDPEALGKAKEELSTAIEKEKFIQFLFFSQWQELTTYAHRKRVTLIGDIPFYVNHDSADCWANTQYFKLNQEKQPVKISGVPPDYFSETGQLWGTPVYDWNALEANNFDWWISRLKQNLLLFDIVRLDHFRAFSAYWEVPAGDKTAENGKWVKVPGNGFFQTVKERFPDMPFIAEDLGSLDEEVYELIESFDFPGMKVLQFAFGGDRKENPYLPFNHTPNSLVYTGTHDNNTTRGWFSKAGEHEKTHLRDYSGVEVSTLNVHRILHGMALKSVAAIAIVPMQDVIGLGEEGIMNIPGSTEGNWTWRITAEKIPWQRTKELKKLNELFGRWTAS